VTALRAAATLLVTLMLAACMQVRSTFVQVTYQPSASEATSSALDEMASKFEGDYSRQQIKARLDTTFARYGLEPTEDNYRMAADVLFTLSTNAMEMGCAACTQMAIVEVISTGTLPAATCESAARMAVDVLGVPPPGSGDIPQ
jgi:hypothetical protein